MKIEFPRLDKESSIKYPDSQSNLYIKHVKQSLESKNNEKKSKLILYKLDKHDNFKNTQEGDIATAAEHFENLYKIITSSAIQNITTELIPNTGDE